LIELLVDCWLIRAAVGVHPPGCAFALTPVDRPGSPDVSQGSRWWIVGLIRVGFRLVDRPDSLGSPGKRVQECLGPNSLLYMLGQ
jgi:hypothetical protein